MDPVVCDFMRQAEPVPLRRRHHDPLIHEDPPDVVGQEGVHSELLTQALYRDNRDVKVELDDLFDGDGNGPLVVILIEEVLRGFA